MLRAPYIRASISYRQDYSISLVSIIWISCWNLMPRSHWENTSAMVKYTNFLPMLPVASQYFGKKHKWSHYKLDFLGFGEGPANHGHECSAMAPDARGSIPVGMGMHRRAVANHTQGIREALANGYWGVYICHFGAQHHSLSGLWRGSTSLCGVQNGPFLWTFYISNIISIYNRCRTFGEFRECFGVHFGDDSVNLRWCIPEHRRRFAEHWHIAEASANLRGTFGDASGMLRRQ